jgi:plastocyanin
VRHSRVTTIVAVLATLLILPPQAGAVAREPDAGPPAARVVAGGMLNIEELNFVFIPDPANVQLGQTVQWVNRQLNDHDTTGDAPLSLWDSGNMSQHETFSYAFTAGGAYPYLCTIHERYNMVSSIRVRDTVDPPSGPVGTIFTVTVASIPAPTDYVYDVQRRAPVGTWKDWMMGLTATSVQFNSTGKPTGTYQFRSRLHRVSDDASSDYSPPASITVTALRPTQPQTDVPFPRAQAGLAFVPSKAATLLFGGENLGAYMNDTWAWNGTKWNLQFPSKSPGPRAAEAMVYDAARKQVVMFGGYNGYQYLRDTWVWDGRTWTQMHTASAPDRRGNMGMVYDAAHRVVVLFGGGARGLFRDTWTWDGAEWTKQAPANSPSVRSDFGMVYDRVHQEVILFGGQGAQFFGDTWTWDGTDWTKRSPASSPGARWGPGMGYDVVNQDVVLFGGDISSGPLGDTWTWNGTNWTEQFPATSPAARFRFPMDWSPNNQPLLFGGNGADVYGDTWTWDGSTWVQR